MTLEGRTPALGNAGERRQITALFYDIVGSTEILNKMDPEDLGQLQQKTHEMAAAAIQSHGGTLDQVMGDGGCAFFGFPAPAEDAAQSAVEAGLDFLERYRRLADLRVLGLAPRLRIGIATGLVVINPRAPTGALGQSHNTLVGLAPTMAARLQSIAEPNTIVIADLTYRMTRWAIECEDLGTVALKGFEQTQRIWRPVRKRPVPDRFSGSLRAGTALVGRDTERTSILERWRRARSGQGQIVELAGEPGIGKSRLTADLRREVTDDGGIVRIFQCQPRGNSRPLHPFIDGLRFQAMRTSVEPGSEDTGVHLRHNQIEQVLPDCSEQTRQIISFLMLEDRDVPSVGATYQSQSGEEFRRQALDAAINVVSGWCGSGPQLLVIEDMHWADTLTIALLERLIGAVATLPMMVVATTREQKLARSADDHVLSLSLPRLGAETVAPLVGAVWSPRELPAGLATFIAEKSDGVPLFAEELAVFLKERPESAPAGPQGWAQALRDNSIATLEDLLAARLASLGVARGTAQLASVIGREFSLELLSRLASIAGAGVAVEDDLSMLVQSGLVHRIDASDHPLFRFRHVLIQEAAYNSLLKTRRRELHDRVVDLILETPGIDFPDDIMAWHCEQAGRNRLAAVHAIRAGEACAIRSAPHEAARMLELAARCLEACERNRDINDLMLTLLTAQGPVAVTLHGKGSPEARAIYDRGVAICRAHAIEDREKWFPLYWGWWFTSPNGVVKRKRSEVIIRDLARANQPETRLQAYHCSWAANFHAGNHALCLQAIDNGLELYDPERARESRARYGGHDAKVCGLAERGLSLWFGGADAQASENIEAAIQWAETTEHVQSVCHALDFALMLNRYRGDAAVAASLAARLSDLAEANAMPGYKLKSGIFAGWSKALLTSPGEGLREIENGLQLHRAIGTDEDFPVYQEMLAEVLGLTGNQTQGIDVLTAAIGQAETTGNLFWVPELYRRRASLRGTRGEPLAAGPRRDLEQALTIAEKIAATSLILRAKAELDRIPT